MTKADAFVTDGDLGSGEPGSSQWHKCQIAQMSDEEIIEYLKEAFDMSVTTLALEIIDGHGS